MYPKFPMLDLPLTLECSVARWAIITLLSCTGNIELYVKIRLNK